MTQTIDTLLTQGCRRGAHTEVCIDNICYANIDNRQHRVSRRSAAIQTRAGAMRTSVRTPLRPSDHGQNFPGRLPGPFDSQLVDSRGDYANRAIPMGDSQGDFPDRLIAGWIPQRMSSDAIRLISAACRRFSIKALFLSPYCRGALPGR